jgi:hypothetical protein
VKPNNEASLKSVQSSIQPDGQFIHPVIRLFTATLNPSIYNNPKSVPSSRRTVFFCGWVCFCGSSSGTADTTHRATLNPSRHPAGLFFLGGFVFVAAAVVGQTQHRDIDFLGGFVFVAFGEPTVGVNF